MRAVKNRMRVHLDTAANLVTHVGRNPHVTALTGIRTDLDDDNASTLGKNTFIARTEVGIDIPSKSLSLVTLLLHFTFEASDLRLDATLPPPPFSL